MRIKRSDNNEKVRFIGLLISKHSLIIYYRFNKIEVLHYETTFELFDVFHKFIDKRQTR